MGAEEGQRASSSYSASTNHSWSSSLATTYVPPQSMFKNARGLDRILASASQQRLRQLRKVHQMRRQAEKQLALHRAQEEKEEKDRLRQLAQDALCRKARAERQLQEALVEQRRKDAAAKAETLAEEQRQRLLEKERIAEANRIEAEQKRQAAEVQRKLEDLQREEERQEARRRAEADLRLKVNYYERKGEISTAVLRQRQLEQELERRAQAEEARERAEIAKQRLLMKMKRDEEHAAELERRVMEKLARVDIIEAQRQSIEREMQRARKDIATQEAWLKVGLEKMALTGRVQMTPELAELERDGLLKASSFDSTRLLLQFPSPLSMGTHRTPRPKESKGHSSAPVKSQQALFRTPGHPSDADVAKSMRIPAIRSTGSYARNADNRQQIQI